MSDTSSHIHSNGVRREFQTLEKEVWEWVLQERKTKGKLPSRKLIQNHALEIYQKAGHQDFKASVGWYRRWEKRYDLRKIRDSDAQTAALQIVDTGKQCEQELNTNIVDAEYQKFPNIDLNNDVIFSNNSLENFSTDDTLIGNIEMINSPSEFFNFGDSFDKSLDSVDVYDSLKSVTDSDTVCMKNFMKELIDDFGKYFSENEKSGETRTIKFNKKSCKYDDDFKDKVIQYINDHCIKEAANKFNVHRDTIAVWMKNEDFHKNLTEIINENKTKNQPNQEAAKKEKEFLDWLSENEKNDVVVSKSQVKNKISGLLIEGDVSANSHWFIKYCHRYINQNEGNKTPKIQYSDQFQKLIVNYSNKTSQIKAASVFNLARKQLFNWMKNIRSERNINKQRANGKLLQWYNSHEIKPDGKIIREKAKTVYCTEGADIICSSTWYYKWCAKNKISVKSHCDEEIVKWILESYDLNSSVSHQDVQQKALEIYRNNMEGEFKASSGWLLRFCRRYMDLLRRVPPISAQLPITCEENVENFRRNLSTIKSKHCIDLQSFGVMDEIFLRLKPLGIIESNNKKTLLRSCGLNNIQGTVILACLADGFILPPLLILKDKNIDQKLHRCEILYHLNGIVDDDVLLDWLKNIWFKSVKSPNILLLDSFAPHVKEPVKEYFTKENSFVEVIPAGCSSKLNPLLQIITPLFQESIDENCKKWFNANNCSWQLGGNSPLLSSEDIIHWVEKAYEAINTENIKENVRKMFLEMNLISA
ncbi:uncharacterized protein LOC135842892 isoform X2 [Planococcus citri]|uniref:uncharacterized protein LOC135842892 isoform X2 n=1 Tax=Planococcus citri TaxID=170843 RepID=UPI0031F9FD41